MSVLYLQIIIWTQFIFSICAVLFGVYLGYRMGQNVVGKSAPLIFKEKAMKDKDALDTPDIFSEALNDSSIDDPNDRLDTL